MNWYKLLKLATPKTLYHGTSIDKYDSIKELGLIPMTGDFVSDSYAGEYESVGQDFDPIDLVFAADKKELRKAVTAMEYSIMKFLNKKWIGDVTPLDVRNYGVIVVIKRGEEDFQHRPREESGPFGDWQGETDNLYPAVEPGDYFSEENVGVTYILTGNKLVDFLKRNNQWNFSNSNKWDEEKRKQLQTMITRYHINKSPKFKDTIKKEVNEKIKNMNIKEIDRYFDIYKDLINNYKKEEEKYELV